MRLLILPAALLLGAALYTNFPQMQEILPTLLRRGYSHVCRLFLGKDGKADERSAQLVFFLALAASAIFLSAIHPLIAMAAAAPLFSGFALLPACAKVKQELHSGAFSKDIPEYERRVIAACAPLGDAFAHHIAAPLLLCALGLPLSLGCALGWVYMGLCAFDKEFPWCSRVLRPIRQAGETALVSLLLLCAGLVGRNPLRVGGKSASEKLMHLLCLEGDVDHAPIAGDITQSIFLCCLSAALLCGLLSAIILFLL